MSTGVATTGLAGAAKGGHTPAQATRERVLVTGFETPAGRAIAAAFAARGARLVLQSTITTDPIAAAAGRLAETAQSVSVYTGPLATRADVLATTQTAVRALGGIDAVVVVVDLLALELEVAAADGDIEAIMAEKLAPPLETIRVTGNRMGVTWTKGTIVTALVAPPALEGGAALIARFVKGGLAGLVRREAERLSVDEIRVVAVAASGANDDPCTPDLADLVIALTRSDTTTISGLLYEARFGG